ncbi:MAG: hypothetical protein AB8E15_09860 [Bdellovibrionales bacterium]
MKLILFSAIFYFVIFMNLSISKDSSFLKPKIYPPSNLKHFTFGFDSVLADLFWLRVIQDIDYCENETGVKSVNSGTDIDSIVAKELSSSRCNMGWVYQMVDLVTELSPRFRRAYRIGAEVLSVGVDDREGARRIFDKGVKQFPKYWMLHYSAAYHYLFEIQDKERAADLLVSASKNGGPYFLAIMASSLYQKDGQKAVALSLLRGLEKKYEDIPEFKEEIQKKIQTIKNEN